MNQRVKDPTALLPKITDGSYTPDIQFDFFLNTNSCYGLSSKRSTVQASTTGHTSRENIPEHSYKISRAIRKNNITKRRPCYFRTDSASVCSPAAWASFLVDEQTETRRLLLEPEEVEKESCSFVKTCGSTEVARRRRNNDESMRRQRWRAARGTEALSCT